MKLINPTLGELDAAFAEKVAGWVEFKAPMFNGAPSMPYTHFDQSGRPRVGADPFTRSMDAVVPWLEKWNESWEISFYNGTWNIAVESPKGPMLYGWVKDTSLPLACCIALLRANGVEVEFTK